MWDRKRVNLNITHAKPLPRMNGLDASQPLAQPVWQSAMQRVHGRLSHIKRRLPHPQHLRQTVAVIAMFVGNQDPVEVLDVFLNRRKSRQRFAFAQSSVNQEAGTLGLE
jgi:hypothetical protein